MAVQAGAKPPSLHPSVNLLNQQELSQPPRSCGYVLAVGLGDFDSRTLHGGLFVNFSLADDGEFDTLSAEILGLKRGEQGSQEEITI